MVMSVKTLLTGLADSVRFKTGKSGKMTLEQIALSISGITVAGDKGFKCGKFTASSTGSARTVYHGLGQVPGAVLFIKKSGTDSSGGTASVFYDSLFSIVYGKNAGHAYCYQLFQRYASSGSSATRTWSNSNSVPSAVFGTDNENSSYYVTNINESTFTTPTKLVSGRTYVWIAFRDALV